MYALVLFSFFLTSNRIVAQTFNNCESKEICEECIHEVECAWCIDPLILKVGEKSVHCHLKNDTRTLCASGMEVSPTVSEDIVHNYDFSNDIDNPIQIKPQRIKLRLRKGEKYDLKFQYKSTENYPIDLYYIMDLSASMKNYKRKLGQLGIKLAETMKQITTNFRLGFGSFIDKTDLPFVNTNKSKLVRPCQNCVTPYSFKNHLSLTSDFKDFVEHVTKANDSGNLDSPEGGLDALMQAIVCKDKIKWREKARHLIVFSTDAEYHVAGDGKLAGVVEPNNGKCHLSDEDYLIYDYPSISQLNYVAKENNINIIFAIVTKGKHDIKSSYNELSKNIENSNFGELNDRDDNNIINLVVDNYKKIVQTVRFTSNATDRVDIKFSSTCQSSIPDRCNNVHVGEILEFTATIQPRECNPKGLKTERISLKPEALNEGLIVELDVQCDCPCSKKTDKTYKPNSDKCSNQGDLKCGICSCPEGRFGRQCECDGSISVSENITNCIMEGSSEVCSGFGKCKCGKCDCSLSLNGEIYGQFCQCNNYSCRKEGGLLCSGKGKCKCKSCECQAGYSGEACECEESTDKCIMKGSDKICSNNGKCDCGRCKCADGYSGTYCDECMTCPGQSHRCEEYRHCVECKAYGTGFYSKSTCEEKCKAFVTRIVDKLGGSHNKSNICTVSDNKRCMMTFHYYYENGTITIQVLRQCNEPPKAFVWISGVVLSIIIAGIVMLLVWKIFISLHDRREYAKFEKERQALKWHRTDNPLYKEATTTFANPAYNRTSSFTPK